jgi:hypothetical protein
MMLKAINVAALFVLVGCATGETDSSRLYDGQWTTAQSIGSGKYIIQGYSTQDAVRGATEFCASTNKQLSTEKLETHTDRSRATITFSCR